MEEERDRLHCFSSSISLWDPRSKVNGRHEKEQPPLKFYINYFKFKKYFLSQQATTIAFRLVKIKKKSVYLFDVNDSLKGTTSNHTKQE